MKTIITFLLLLGLVFATCNYDVGRGIVTCDGNVITHSTSNITVYKKTFLTMVTVVNPNYIPPVKVTSPETTPKPTPVVEQKAFVKSAEQCQWARDRDWKTYIGIMYGEKMTLDGDNANAASKAAILDQLLASKSSNQYLCRTGVLNG